MRINIAHNSDYFVEHNQPFFFLIVALVGCTISINFSFLLQRFALFKFLRIVGFHSLFIYCLQIIAMAMVRLVLIKGLHIVYAPVLVPIVWTMGILLPMIFYNICLRLHMWWLFTYQKPENEINFRSGSAALVKDPL
jgi:predicted cation transporter